MMKALFMAAFDQLGPDKAVWPESTPRVRPGFFDLLSQKEFTGTTVISKMSGTLPLHSVFKATAPTNSPASRLIMFSALQGFGGTFLKRVHVIFQPVLTV
jgi:hypothetical protein